MQFSIHNGGKNVKLLFAWLKQNAGMLHTQFCWYIAISLLKYFTITVNHLQLLMEIFPFFKSTFKGADNADQQVLREGNSGEKKYWCTLVTCLGLISNKLPLRHSPGSVQEFCSPATTTLLKHSSGLTRQRGWRFYRSTSGNMGMLK